MKILFKTARLALAVLPNPVKEAARSLMPVPFKRYLGRGVMSEMIANSDGFVQVKDGRKFKTIEDRLFLRVMCDREYEPALSQIASQLIEPGDKVIDVGANFGWYTTLFATLAGNGRVLSYEPSPRTFGILSANIVANDLADRVHARNVCVGATSGTVTMELGDASESGLAHIVDSTGATTAEIQMVSLDEDYGSTDRQVAYVKIDVEGYETPVLEGARQLLGSDHPPIVQIEVNDEALERAGSSRQAVIDLLSGHGYEFWEAIGGSSGKICRADLKNASDLFCFASGVFGERRSKLSDNLS